MRMQFMLYILLILSFGLRINAAEQLQSPDGKVTIEAGVKTFDQPLPNGNFLCYQVSYLQNEIVQPSPVLFLLPDGEIFGSEVAITEVIRKSINESSELLYGKSSILLTHCNEMQLTLEETGGKKRKFMIFQGH